MQAALDGVTSTAWGRREGGGRRDGAGETAADEEKRAWKECKAPERGVWGLCGVGVGVGGCDDVISIDSQGEHTFTVLYSCYH